MDIDRYYSFDWVNPNQAPDDKAVYAAAAQSCGRSWKVGGCSDE